MQNIITIIIKTNSSILIYIRMMYYGLSEGLGNDCWKFSFANTYIHLILKYIKIEHIY